MKHNFGGDMKKDRSTSAHQALLSSQTVLKVAVLGGALAFLGASCWNGVQTNSNVAEVNTNTAVNENTSVENNSNTIQNTNENTNSSDQIDTSDWLTYTSPIYRFSINYPRDWVVFNEISHEDGSLILDEENLSYLRFTSAENDPAPETSFQDITLGVKDLENFDADEVATSNSDKFFIGEKYVIHIAAGTWAGEFELQVLNAMYESITF